MNISNPANVRLCTYAVDGPAMAALSCLQFTGHRSALWDPILAAAQGPRIIRFDKRGHGLSSCPLCALCEWVRLIA